MPFAQVCLLLTKKSPFKSTAELKVKFKELWRQAYVDKSGIYPEQTTLPLGVFFKEVKRGVWKELHNGWHYFLQKSRTDVLCWWCCYLPKKWSVRKYYRRHLYRLWEKKYVQICMQTYVLTLRTCTKYGRFWHLHAHTHCCPLITIAEEEEEKIVGSCRPSKSTILLRHLMPTFDISFTRNLMTLLLFSHGDIFFN